jgi:predicted O-linked N-acetylglucosamine transferase (SPINDLY family)
VTRLPALGQRGIRWLIHNPAKMNDAVIALWAQVLAAVPEATLVLKTHILNRARTREWLIARFGAHGIPPSRLEMRGGRPEQTFHADLLGSYGEIDVALDPFPYTGGITTLEALWMGVPVITLAGDTLLSRMGVSSLHAAGLPEFVAATPQAYVEIAVRCGRDLSWLAGIREAMRCRLASSPLMDAAAFTRDLEAAYRQIWRKWCAAGASGERSLGCCN